MENVISIADNDTILFPIESLTSLQTAEDQWKHHSGYIHINTPERKDTASLREALGIVFTNLDSGADA